jgi:hypothetical protein
MDVLEVGPALTIWAEKGNSGSLKFLVSCVYFLSYAVWDSAMMLRN